jgi:16S rRNA (cytosine967-C5)-methyltransferase
MRDGGRIEAVIAVLDKIETRHLPFRQALKSWGEEARYAGSKDRAFVAGLVLDVLRRKRSLAAIMGAESDRARVLGALRWSWGWSVARVAEAAGDDAHGPGALTEAEQHALNSAGPIPPLLRAGDHAEHGGRGPGLLFSSSQPAAPTINMSLSPPQSASPGGEQFSQPILGDYPDWLDASLARVFGAARAAECAALAERAPVDLRVNTLKADVARAMKALEPLGVGPANMLLHALRLPAPAAADRAPAIESAPEFAKGWFEVQDLGSQIAACAAGEIKGRQVLDFCAGGGGKTLALAAMMGNSGQLYAYDSEARRLTDTVTRGQRAGVRNLQVRSPLRPDALSGLEAKMDLVFVDAPCTGSGTWRRHPDAKWRLTPAQLERRMAEQAAVLAAAQAYVRPGGRLVYVTCSLLMEENEDRLAAFLGAYPSFVQISALEQIAASALASEAGLAALTECATREGALRLTPRNVGTDGFFIAVLERRP